MKVKCGSFLTDASGKIGGQVFQHTGSGLMLRSSTYKSHAKSSSQELRRQNFSLITTSWRSLSQSQRNSWLVHSLAGKSGFSLFTSINLLRLANGMSLAVDYTLVTEPTPIIYGTNWSEFFTSPSGTVIFTICHVSDSIILYGTNSPGHIFRSVDSGANFTDLGQFAGQTNIYSIISLGGGIVLAGTGAQGHILRSIDYGATWTDLGRLFSLTQISSLHHVGSGVVLAVGNFGNRILRSTDYGATWSNVGLVSGVTAINCFVNVNSSLIIAGCTGAVCLRSSSDGGLTWSEIDNSPGIGSCRTILKLSTNRLVLFGDPLVSSFTSDNDGVDWSNEFLFENGTTCYAAIAFPDDTLVAGLSNNAYLYRSTDLGVMFSLQLDQSSQQYAYSASVDSTGVALFSFATSAKLYRSLPIT